MFKNFIKSIRLLLGAYVALIAMLLLLGYDMYRGSMNTELTEWKHNLQSIGHNKSEALSNWFNERYADALFLYKNEYLIELIESYAATGSKSDSLKIASSVSSIYESHDYANLIIVDNYYKILVDLNPVRSFDILKDSLDSSQKSKRIVVTNLYVDSLYKDIVMDYYIPVFQNGKFIAAIIFKIDPHELLFPIITSSFRENTTAESIIFSVEQDNILFYSPLKITENKSHIYIRSVNEADLPVAKHLKTGMQSVQGIDYRGKEVLADIVDVGDTPWHIVTKIDLTEVYEPVNSDTMKNILILGAIILIGGLALLVYYTVGNYNNLKNISEAEKKFKDIFENSIDAIIILRDERITDCNPYTFTLFGLNKKELIGKSLSDLSPFHQPDGRESSKIISGYVNLATTGIEQQFEWAFLRAGNLIYTDISLSNFTANGKKMSTAFIRDVTTRTIFEETNRKLSRAVEYSPLSIVITDINANIEYVNPKFTALTGYLPGEVIGKNPNILSAGTLEQSTYKDLWATIKSGNSWFGEFCNKKKDGTLFWEAAMISPIMDANDKITHFIAIKEDITEKKKINEHLALQSKMLDSIGQAVIAINPDATIMYMNSTAERLFGWSNSEVLNKNIVEIGIPDDFISSAKQFLIQLLLNGSFTGELVVKRKDGTQFPVLLTGAQFENQAGELSGYIGIFTDLTEIKRKEIELQLAKENAEEMNRLKSTFLANMSHELRTPLTGILGFTELLQEELPDTGPREMIDYIKSSGQRLLNTFNSILDLSSIEANRYKVINSELNMDELLQKEINLFRSAAYSKDVVIIPEAPKGPSIINSDEHILTNIISNLINNAVKFTHTGKITVGFYFSEMASAKFLNIFVRDTGIGIPDDAKKIIFEEFRQVSEGLGRSYEGSGLGLAITSKFVKMLNGEIIVYSKVGLGSEFVVKIPLGSTHGTVFNPKYETDFIVPQLTEKEIVPSGVFRILVVEDDDSNSKFIKHVLESRYSVDLVDNGQSAIRFAGEFNYDLILMDINLGLGIDGIAVLKNLRSIEKYSDKPIIAITAYAMMGDRSNFLNEGFTDYISKPFAIAELVNVVAKHLSVNSVTNTSQLNK